MLLWSQSRYPIARNRTQVYLLCPASGQKLLNYYDLLFILDSLQVPMIPTYVLSPLTTLAGCFDVVDALLDVPITHASNHAKPMVGASAVVRQSDSPMPGEWWPRDFSVQNTSSLPLTVNWHTKRASNHERRSDARPLTFWCYHHRFQIQIPALGSPATSKCCRCVYFLFVTLWRLQKQCIRF
jgi:hypothetical protein